MFGPKYPELVAKKEIIKMRGFVHRIDLFLVNSAFVFCVFRICSTSCCLCDRLMGPGNGRTYVCMFVCMYACTYVWCMYVRTYVCVYVLCMYILCIYVCVYVYM